MGAPLYNNQTAYRGAPRVSLYRSVESKTSRRRKIGFTPHEGQKRLLRDCKRFNYVNCGRRFGKTSLGVFLLMHYALTTGNPVAWYAPNYKDLSEIWKLTKKSLQAAGMVKRKDEQIKQIELTNGSVIDFWSLSNLDSGRGRKYVLVIVDEVAKIKGFKSAWQETLRPTLADYKGVAWLFSTPKGRNNDWYDACTNLSKDSAYFEATSYDNPYLDKSEIDAAKEELPADVFAQEFMAKFVDMSDGLFLTEWDDKYILKGNEEIEIDPTWPLYLSFDFNMDPTTAILYQVIDEPDGGMFFIDEIQVKGGTARICEDLQIYKDHPAGLLVTGDYSGNTGSTVGGVGEGGEYRTDYSIISEALGLSDAHLVDTRTVNKRHVLSRNLCNFAIKNGLIWINQRCTQLISDVATAIPTKSGKLLKDRNFYKNDAMDAFRYAVHTQCNEGLDSLRHLKQLIV